MESLFANEAQQFKALFTDTTERLTEQALRQLGLLGNGFSVHLLMSPPGPGCVKTLAVFLCDGPVGLDGLSRGVLRFCGFVWLTGSRGPDFTVPSGDLAG